MSKMQRFIRALLNNGFSQWENYDLLRADPDGYLYIQERSTKREFKIHVECASPVLELKYEPAKDISFDPNNKPIIVNLEERNKQQNVENDDSMEKALSDMEKTLSDKEILQQEVEKLKQLQDEELKRALNQTKINEIDSNEPVISRPRGWRLMNQFVDADGTVYIKGVEHPELKGTLPPTV